MDKLSVWAGATVYMSIAAVVSGPVYAQTSDMMNAPPKVAIATPTNGSTFFGPTNIEVVAAAFDNDGVARRGMVTGRTGVEQWHSS